MKKLNIALMSAVVACVALSGCSYRSDMKVDVETTQAVQTTEAVKETVTSGLKPTNAAGEEVGGDGSENTGESGAGTGYTPTVAETKPWDVTEAEEENMFNEEYVEENLDNPELSLSIDLTAPSPVKDRETIIGESIPGLWTEVTNADGTKEQVFNTLSDFDLAHALNNKYGERFAETTSVSNTISMMLFSTEEDLLLYYMAEEGDVIDEWTQPPEDYDPDANGGVDFEEEQIITYNRRLWDRVDDDSKLALAYIYDMGCVDDAFLTEAGVDRTAFDELLKTVRGE